MKDFTKAQKKKYLKNAGECPKCGSMDIGGDSIEVDGNCCWQTVSCSKCGTNWHDVYTLSNVIKLG